MEKKLMKKPRIILSLLQQADKLSFFSSIPTNSCLSISCGLISGGLISSEAHIPPLTSIFFFESLNDL